MDHLRISAFGVFVIIASFFLRFACFCKNINDQQKKNLLLAFDIDKNYCVLLLRLSLPLVPLLRRFLFGWNDVSELDRHKNLKKLNRTRIKTIN